MLYRLVTVLKKNRVKMSGSVSLEHGTFAPVRTKDPSQADTHSDPNAEPIPREARIIESNNEYAVIEVICSCGSKSHIQCNYAQLTAAAAQ